MKPLPQKYYRVKADYKVGSFSIQANSGDGFKLEYYVDVGRDWMTVYETKKLIRQLHAALRRIENHKEIY